MNNAVTGVLLGLSLFLVTAVESPQAPRPTPPKIEFKTCVEHILYRLNYYSELLVRMKVPYVWGGFWGLLGVDCSGYIYWICKKAGLPVHRTTSHRMWLDRGSWPGERVLVKLDDHYDNVEFPDILFWTYGKRPYGHTAIIVLNALDNNGNRRILFREASSSKKFVKETLMSKGDYRWIRLEGFIVLDLTPGFDCELK